MLYTYIGQPLQFSAFSHTSVSDSGVTQGPVCSVLHEQVYRFLSASVLDSLDCFATVGRTTFSAYCPPSSPTGKTEVLGWWGDGEGGGNVSVLHMQVHRFFP